MILWCTCAENLSGFLKIRMSSVLALVINNVQVCAEMILHVYSALELLHKNLFLLVAGSGQL